LECDGLRVLTGAGAAVFEPLAREETRLRPAHNAIHFWTWGDDECCLPEGTTSATLRDAWAEETRYEGGERPRALALEPGDVLVFEERIGPGTGNPADADPAHRQAVRLTAVTQAVDELYDQPVVEIAWALQDALDFPLCISTFAGEDCAPIDCVSVACGNVVLVDHGATIGWCDGTGERLPDPEVDDPDPICVAPCEPGERLPRPRPYAPALRRHPVTQRTAFPMPASRAQREAEIIGAIPGRVHARLRELLSRVRAGDKLDADMRAELVALFGTRTIAEHGLLRARNGARGLEALERLVAHADHLLADKERRTRALAIRALAGDVLPAIVIEELGELWGARYVEGTRLGTDAEPGPARGTLEQDPRDALPALWIEQRAAAPSLPPRRARRRRAGAPVEAPAVVWEPRRDVLSSAPDDRHFVGELDDDGVLRLRFGVGGRGPRTGSVLTARYRVGNGPAGNVGRDAISRIVLRTIKGAPVARVRNPLPALGGTDPEPLADAKLLAPATFRRRLERAVTAADYATLAELVPGVQRAAARMRWTGSWYEAHVGLDLQSAGSTLVGDVPAAVTARLSRARRLGHDLRVEIARPTPLDVALVVCVASEYRRGQVHGALLDVLSDRALGNGERGLFHPDRLTFGTGIAMSTLVAAAQAVPGVELVQVRRLRRLHGLGEDVPADGVLDLGPLEVPELANDPNDPDRGRLELELRGGR
jgi:predicted phage baseplate assembly protein